MRTSLLILLAATSLNASNLYWTTWNVGTSDGIYCAARDGTGVNQIITEEDLTAPDFSYIVSLPMDLVVDDANQEIYVIETGFDTIWRTDFTGSTFSEVLQISGEDPHQFEIDFENEWIYWVEDNGGEAPARVGRCKLDGSNPDYLINDAGARAGGIAIDVAAGDLFWTETYYFMQPESLAIWRCGLDGSNPQAIVTTFADEAFELGSIAVDSEAQKIYWLQDHLLIRRSDYDGSNVETLYEDEAVGDRSHLAIDTHTDELFWTSLEDKSISRATLDGSSNQRWIEGLSASPFGIALVASVGTEPSIQLGGIDATSFTVTWTQPSTDWQLESSPTLAPLNWTAVPANDISMDGMNGMANLDSTLPQLFLRLRNTAELP